MAPFAGWQQAILTGIGAPATAENLRLLNAWQACEGGTAANNPLNTTQPAAGATDYNSVHVKNYPSAAVGAQATVTTLLNGYYPGMVAALRSGASSAANTLTANSGEFSTWGTSVACIGTRLGTVTAPPGPQGPQPKPKRDTPSTQLPSHPSTPGAHAPRPGNVVHNWHLLTTAIGSVWPTQDLEARRQVLAARKLLRVKRK